MAKGGSVRLWVELAAVAAALAAYWHFKATYTVPQQVIASSVGPMLIGSGPQINLAMEIYDAPFFGETDEEIQPVIGTGDTKQVRVVTSTKLPELRAALTDLIESGRVTFRPAGRASLKPGQPALIKVMGRPLRASAMAAAREELSLAIVGTWTDTVALQLDSWFRRERVEGVLTTQAEGPASGGRSTIMPGDSIVVSQVLDGTRYIVVLRLERPAGP